MRQKQTNPVPLLMYLQIRNGSFSEIRKDQRRQLSNLDMF